MDLDGLRRQAENLLDEHGDEVAKAIDKAEDLAKGRISGHDSQIDQVAGRLRDYVEEHDKSGGAEAAAKGTRGKARPAGRQPGAKRGGHPAAKRPRRPGGPAGAGTDG
jgi:MT0933-like antitoxin protein